MMTGTAMPRGSGLFLLLLASCAEPAPSDETAKPLESASAIASEAETIEASSCGTEKVARFIGAMATPAVRKAIESAAGRAPVRWIAPGQAITLDFSLARLNIMVDERNKIATMRCG
jgi:hypothetical protein